MDARFPAGWTLLIAIACTAHLLLGFGISMLLNWYTTPALPSAGKLPKVEADPAVNGELALVGRGLLELIHQQPALAPGQLRSLKEVLDLVRSLQEKLGGELRAPEIVATTSTVDEVERHSASGCPSEMVNPNEESARVTLPLLSREESGVTKRYPYEMIQYVGPCFEDELPDTSEFQSVQCHDISNEGMSFFLDEPPGFVRFIITLGSMPNLKYMLGEILHHRCVYKLGRTWYLVESRFIERLPPNAFDANSIGKAPCGTPPLKIRA